MLQNNKAHVPRAHAPRQEKLPQQEAHEWQLESSPCLLAPTREKPVHSNKDATQPKIKINKYSLKKNKGREVEVKHDQSQQEGPPMDAHSSQ